MTPDNQHVTRQTEELSRKLYEQYGKPLEAEHTGEYVAIAKDGGTLLGSSLQEVVDNATEALGPGNFVYKIGPRVVGKWR